MNLKNLHKIMVVNRSEISLRVLKAIHEAGKSSAVVYSEADRTMPFVSAADEAWSLGEGTLRETYLNQDKIINIALRAGVDAIHPGYGFLSENAEFAKKCQDNNITFIGPSPEVIDLMGNKANARETAKKFNVPVIEGHTGTKEAILEKKSELTYPLLIKPSAGGGGKGMKIVEAHDILEESLTDAARQAKNFFGSEELYVEHYIHPARHIEVQVIADHHGNAVHLFERECSLQRRYQKIIEEAPAASISPGTRDKITQSALDLARGIHYTNAGTIEFLVDPDEHFYFIEMNTRIQVEHPVTELVTGKDLVSEQIRVAENKPLSFRQEDVQLNGHAIEARIYAENPKRDFIPSTGKIRFHDHQLAEARVDSGYASGNIVTPYYDPMISKVISHGRDRSEAINQLLSALGNYHLSGIKTNKVFLSTILSSPIFEENKIYTKYLDEKLESVLERTVRAQSDVNQDIFLALISAIMLNHNYNPDEARNIWNETGHWRLDPEIKVLFEGNQHRIKYEVIERKLSFMLNIGEKNYHTKILRKNNSRYKIQIDEHQFTCWADVNISEIWLDYQHISIFARRLDIPDERYMGNSSDDASNTKKDLIIAPLNGKVVKINATEGSKINKGDVLVVIESMKMENKIVAVADAEVKSIHIKVNDLVEQNKVLIKLNE